MVGDYLVKIRCAAWPCVTCSLSRKHAAWVPQPGLLCLCTFSFWQLLELCRPWAWLDTHHTVCILRHVPCAPRPASYLQKNDMRTCACAQGVPHPQ